MSFSGELLAWYDAHRRFLPWREEKSPYRVWISEIMAQQTRIEAMLPYFERFIAELPDVESLAACDDDRLLKLWEGLGYYSRARNLKKAAIEIVERFGGELPADFELLKTLPGIGPYTAGAIASMAFGLPVIAADGNAYRIASRVLREEGELESSKTKKRLEAFLSERLPEERPADYNQALMDLGSGVCIPNGAPLCGSCPVRAYCLSAGREDAVEYPRKKPKKARRLEKLTVLVMRLADRTAFVRRKPEGVLSGMWGFPTFPGWLGAEEIRERIETAGWRVLSAEELGEQVHIFSHIEWHMKGYEVELAEKKRPSEPAQTAAESTEPYAAGDLEGLFWADDMTFEREISLPGAFRRFWRERPEQNKV